MGDGKVARGLNSRKLLNIKVGEVMNRRPRTVLPQTSIDDLLERLLAQIEDCFPVVDKKQRLLGIVTESDVLQVLHPPAPKATVGPALRVAMKVTAKTVGEIMTKNPISVTPDTTVAEALNLMSAHKLRRLPVVEGEKLVGLISLRDILALYRVLK